MSSSELHSLYVLGTSTSLLGLTEIPIVAPCALTGRRISGEGRKAAGFSAWSPLDPLVVRRFAPSPQRMAIRRPVVAGARRPAQRFASAGCGAKQGQSAACGGEPAAMFKGMPVGRVHAHRATDAWLRSLMLGQPISAIDKRKSSRSRANTRRTPASPSTANPQR